MHSADSDSQSIARYLEPQLEFIQRKTEIAGSESGEKRLVSQLVRKGAVLAGFANYQAMKKKGYLRSRLEAGVNVELDEQSYTLVATASGYPRTRVIKEENEPDILLIDIIPVVKISHNLMQASLILHPALVSAPSLDTDNLDELIAEAGILSGIEPESLEKIQHLLSGPRDDFEEVVFAQGSFPGEGVDAWLRFELEIGPLAGHIHADGTIDFRDRKIMVGVMEGQHLATKIPAVPGASGYNVFGEEIEAKTGKDIRVMTMGDAKFIIDELKVIAARGGAMSVINQNTIKVAAKTTITGDVDFATGNIESEQHVVIEGSVNPGFLVNVGGDLGIGGQVSSTTIQCAGNAVLKGGITGKSTSVIAGGDVDLKFIERGRIQSGGLVVIRKQCYYSTIEAAAEIRCHPESSILGGILLAGGSMNVGNVGAESCEPATIGAGIDAERYELFQQLYSELIEQKEEIIQTIQLHGRGSRPKKIRRMEEAALATKKQLFTLNLIPGTELYSRIGMGKDRDDLEEEDPMYVKDTRIEDVRIEVHGKMYAGTTILLGNRSITLENDVVKKKFRLSKNLKRIMVLPL